MHEISANEKNGIQGWNLKRVFLNFQREQANEIQFECWDNI